MKASALAALLSITLVGTVARADEPASQDLGPPIGKDELAKRYLGLSANNIHNGPFAGLYEVAVDMNVSYVTTDGRYLIRGEIVDLTTQQSLTQSRLDETRAGWLAAVDPATEIVFAAADAAPTYRLYVFTDVDCGYCRQFHRDIAAVNALGVEVHYLSYPRTGPNTESWSKAEAVWCSNDRAMALTSAKLGADVAPKPGCKTDVVAEHYNLGQRLQIVGTPAIYTDGGVDVGGYFPPAELVAHLAQIAAAGAAK